MFEEFERHRLQHLARKRRVRRFLKPLPRRANVRRYPILKWFADFAHRRPYLWSFKREHVVPAIYVGSVIACIPIPLQTFWAFLLVLLVRGNLPLVVALQWISNPFTFLPLYGLTYYLGRSVVQLVHPEVAQVPAADAIRAMTDGEFSGALDILGAFIIGGVAVGLVCGLLIDLLWRFLAWEARVFQRKFASLHAAVEQRRADESARVAEARNDTD